MAFILTEKRGAVGIITFNRPEVFNAMNWELLDEFEQAVEKFDADGEVGVIILTGAGKGFMAGADLSICFSMNSVQAKEWIDNMNRIFGKVAHANKPVIAAVNGAAMGGGCELSCACDIRLASTKAKFALPESGLGIIPGAGGTQRLPRLIGAGMAKELAYSGRLVDAAEAREIGLVNHVYEPEELLDKAVELGNKIAANGRFAIRRLKIAIDRGLQMDVDDGIALEAEACAMCFSTADKTEGMKAFLEKRPAEFTDCR